jgi:hypothetical protein
MMSSIIKVSHDAKTQTAMMPQVVLQEDDFNQDGNDTTLLNDLFGSSSLTQNSSNSALGGLSGRILRVFTSSSLSSLYTS